MSKENNETSITFKTLVSLFQEFNGEKHLTPQQLNVMRHTEKLLNTWDRKGSCNYDKSYKVIEQKPKELTVEPDVVEAYQESLREWKKDWIAMQEEGFNTNFNRWCADHAKSYSSTNERLKADKKILNERLTKVAVKRDELELALQDSHKIRVDLEDRIADQEADLIKQDNEVESQPLKVAKTTALLDNHSITIFDDNTIKLSAHTENERLQSGTLVFKEDMYNSTILEYCERNVV